MFLRFHGSAGFIFNLFHEVPQIENQLILTSLTMLRHDRPLQLYWFALQRHYRCFTQSAFVDPHARQLSRPARELYCGI